MAASVYLDGLPLCVSAHLLVESTLAPKIGSLAGFYSGADTYTPKTVKTALRLSKSFLVNICPLVPA